MKKKYFHALIICFASIVIYCLLLGLYAIFQVGTVFQESIAAIATIALILGIGAIFGMQRFAVFEKIITIGLALSLTFNFAISGIPKRLCLLIITVFCVIFEQFFHYF
jgi:hypothetical protein